MGEIIGNSISFYVLLEATSSQNIREKKVRAVALG
jgi:hypothetical protein